MISSLIKPLIQRGIEDYVVGGAQATDIQVSLSMFGEQLFELKDLDLRCADVLSPLALGHQGFPFQIDRIFMDSLTVKIPLVSLGSKSVSVHVSKLQVVVRFQEESEWSEEKVLKDIQEAVVAAVEAVWLGLTEKLDDDSFGFRMAGAIWDNLDLQVEHMDIVLQVPRPTGGQIAQVRVPDPLDVVEIGIHADSLTLHTVDENGDVTFHSTKDGVVYKKVSRRFIKLK